MPVFRPVSVVLVAAAVANCGGGNSTPSGAANAGSINNAGSPSAASAGNGGSAELGGATSLGDGGLSGSAAGNGALSQGGRLDAAAGGGGGSDLAGSSHGGTAVGGGDMSSVAGAGNATGGSSTAGAGGKSGEPAPFTCTLLVGPTPMFQWFNGGFLTYPGIDASRYELLMVGHHYTNVWAMPGDPAWKTPIAHPCATGSSAPDRVAFMATQWVETTAAAWEADFDGIIKNILIQWPKVKRIELMPSTCAPGNKLCPGATLASETIIPPYGYEAIDAMPAKYPGLVFSTPHFEVPKCSDFIGNGTAPQYAPNATATTGPAVLDVVGVFGAYYAAHP